MPTVPEGPLDAVAVCRERCFKNDWVIDLDITKFAAIADWADSNSYPVAFMCVELGVSRSGYTVLSHIDYGPNRKRN